MHLTIGEVLSLLKEEFPDVSISKIRFLESQGLVDPERTPSGYRKFYDHDVDRLRWILRQQREHFLPLKVIRGRLAGDDDSDTGDPAGATLVAEGSEPQDEAAEVAGGRTGAGVASEPEGQVALAFADAQEAGRPDTAHRPDAAAPPDAAHGPDAAAPPDAAPPSPLVAEVESVVAEHRDAATGTGNGNRPRASTADPVDLSPEPEAARTPATAATKAGGVARAESSRPAKSARSQAQGDVDDRPPAVTAHPDVYTAAELAGQVGCAVALINELVQYGILTTGANVGGVSYFDPGSLALARIGARFSELGVEPRHLRTWRNAAEREAGLFEQLVMPLLRQRNPQARQQAVERLDELTRLGGDLRSGLVAEAIRQIR